MKYNDLKISFCPFCGARLANSLLCNNCGKASYIFKEYGTIQYDLVSKIKWSDDTSIEQRNAILEIISDMVFIKGGSFTMGTPVQNISPDWIRKQTPHRVTLTPFYISKFLVTQRQWFTFMNPHNCEYVGEDLPVDSVSWLDCRNFCTILENKSGLHFSLPLEAQWFYVAKECDDYFEQDQLDLQSIDMVAWTKSNSNGTSHRPGLKMPNKLGIYDLYGNLSEHCLDRWGNWSKEAITNPVRPIGNGNCNMVRKGGSVLYDSYGDFESAYNVNSRDCRSEDARMADSGLRLAIFNYEEVTEF